ARPARRAEGGPARAARRLAAAALGGVLVAVAVMPAAALADDLSDPVAHLGHHDVPHLTATATHGFDVLSDSWRGHAVGVPLDVRWVSIFAEDLPEDPTDFTQSCIPSGRLDHGVHEVVVPGAGLPHPIQPRARSFCVAA